VVDPTMDAVEAFRKQLDGAGITATSLSPAAARVWASADSMPSVTKVNVVPFRLVTGLRAWWVMTNTGWWKGGRFPHQPSAFGSSSQRPSPPLNMRLPITVAPMLPCCSR
jgi:hypothetical protein